MARFPIISQSDSSVVRYEGTPTYNGTYLKPSYIEFREVSSPTPIEWEVGDYVDYTRTGLRYRLYSKPQIKKQARSNSYGGAFVYSNVQLFERTKDFDICPFRDIVMEDNNIHFSSQPSISTFEDVGGIARRIQACLDDMYDDWVVRVVNSSAPDDAEFMALISEPRDYTVSGASILGALDKIYEVWPLCGWTYSVENGKNVLTIGGANVASAKNAANSFRYGKGNGLRNIKKTYTNEGELATRIYAYGSSRNMIARYYNNIPAIKDHESVDIVHLMLPINGVDASYSGWGMTDGERDANKAFIENESATEEFGLRPTTAYFDGTGDLEEIYPSIEGVTIGDLRSAMDPSDDYYPKSSWAASQRLDEIVSAGPVDDGQTATDGNKFIATASDDNYSYIGDDVLAGTQVDLLAMTLQSPLSGKASFTSGISGTISVVSGNMTPRLTLSAYSSNGGRIVDVKLIGNPTTGYTFEVPSITASVENVTYVNFYIHVMAAEVIDPSQSADAPIFDITMSGSCSAGLQKEINKKFTVKIPQIGFNIDVQGALGEGKTLSMKTGMNAGRSFEIDTCAYSPSDDTWVLTLWRSEDTSLGICFPNTDYPIQSGDKYVILDIAMPELYILTASVRLLNAARELLSRLSALQPFYEPDVDAIFMAEHSLTLKEGRYMAFTDTDIIPAGEVMLVDSVTINEGEAIIPTYKVTLRERKKISWTKSVERIVNEVSTRNGSSSSNGGGQRIDLSEYALASDLTALSDDVAELATTVTSNTTRIVALEDLFEVVNVAASGQTPVYAIRPKHGRPFFSDSWISAFGAGSGGGGGGGGADLSDVWASLMSNNDDYANEKINIAHIPAFSVSTSGTGNVVAGMSYSNGVFTLTKTTVSSDWDDITNKPDLVTTSSLNSTLASYVTASSLATTLGDYITDSALSSWSGSSNIDTVGTIEEGEWQGTPIANAYLANPSLTIGGTTISLGGSATLSDIGVTEAYLTGLLGNDFHPYGGASDLDFVSRYVTASTFTASGAIAGGSTLTAADSITIGNGSTGTTSAAASKRRIYFGSTSYWLELAYDSTSSSYYLHTNVGIASESWVSALGVGSPSGGGSGGGGIPHVLLTETEYDALVTAGTVDPGVIYLVYEDES